VSAALLGFAYVVIRNAARGHGPLVSSSPAVNALAVQLFLTLLAAPLLLLASLLEERRQVTAAPGERGGAAPGAGAARRTRGPVPEHLRIDRRGRSGDRPDGDGRRGQSRVLGDDG